MQPTFESATCYSILTKSAEEISEWFYAQRIRCGETSDFPPDCSELRRRFGRLSQMWAPLLTHPLIKRPELAAIHQLAKRALRLSKLIYGELENASQGQSRLVPQSMLSQLLDWNSQLLKLVGGQLELVESTRSYAEGLHDTVIQLSAGQKVAAACLVSLAKRIQSDMQSDPEIWQWMPWPGQRLSDCLTPRTWKSEREVYATGIQTARLAAWLGNHWPQLASRIELYIVAAMLQDIGFLRLERTTAQIPSETAARSESTYRRHSSLGAGLAAGVGDYSIDLSFLIAQHHERLDGTGYPHGLTSDQQTPESQRFACLVRFQELVFQQSTEWHCVETACFAACFQLFLESAQGAWSTRATIQLIEAIDAELPEAFETALAAGQPFMAEAFLENRWSPHFADPLVPAPHFLLSRPTSAGIQTRDIHNDTRSKHFRFDSEN